MKIKNLTKLSALSLAILSTVSFAETNNKGFEGANLPFVWQNASVYFVITDRFNNGDKTNDNSYGRPYVDAASYNAGTFHGGDIKGLTQRLDYIRSLGVSAIWLTAPYEQIHGWVGGGPMGMYQYYSYHGYWALDFTSMDQNMGTVDDFRNFVTEAHKRGIRVMIDVVMNHVGYSNLKDMCDFKFGKTVNNVDPCIEWKPNTDNSETFHNKPIDERQDVAWNRWWGKDWILAGGYGEYCGADDGLDKCLAYLPDLKNTDTHGKHVTIPEFLQDKWKTFNEKYDIKAAQKYREGSMSVAEFEANWLASWVEEFGIDGFRCDTVKFVALPTWKLLKEKALVALETWRKNNKGKDPAADWKDPFYMTGELWAFTTDPEDKSGYAKNGGFDSLIDFYFNPDGVNMNTCISPDESDIEKYGNLFGRLTGHAPLGNLTYISSHDTSLCRKSDMEKLALKFLMLPGASQIYYGDETNRQNDMGGGIDLEQGMRSDMNFPKDIDSQEKWASNVATYSNDYSEDKVLATWQKIGQFKLRNPAVGAGRQVKQEDGSFCRHFIDVDKDIDNTVLVHIGDTDTVNATKCFADGTVLNEALSGKQFEVKNGEIKGDFKLGALFEIPHK